MRLFNSAREYHDKTKYVYDDVKFVHREFLSEPQPPGFKGYADKPVVQLPTDYKKDFLNYLPTLEKSASFSPFRQLKDNRFDFDQVSQILYLANGVTREREFSNRKVYLRAAPSASGLYPTELYVIANKVDGLDSGIYYFNPREHQLIKLGNQDAKEQAVKAGFNLKFLSKAPLFIIMTSVFPRSSWKFKSRAYRYCLMDAGYVGENLVLAASGMGQAANLVGDFVDDEINKLLQIDKFNEAAIMMAAIGEDDGELGEDGYQFGMLTEEDDIIDELHKSLVHGIHINSSHYFSSEKFVNVNVKFPFRKTPPVKEVKDELINLPDPQKDIEQKLDQIITNRRSSHNFLRIPVSLAQLSTLLFNLRNVPVLYHYPAYHVYVVINDVDELDNGIYIYHSGSHKLEVVKRGTYRGDISYLTLAQDAVFNCSVAIFFSTNFRDIDIFSNRGYRYAHYNVGMLSENLYLTGIALGLAVRGIGNFFDDSINTFFKVDEPHENILGGVIIGHS